VDYQGGHHRQQSFRISGCFDGGIYVGVFRRKKVWQGPTYLVALFAVSVVGSIEDGRCFGRLRHATRRQPGGYSGGGLANASIQSGSLYIGRTVKLHRRQCGSLPKATSQGQCAGLRFLRTALALDLKRAIQVGEEGARFDTFNDACTNSQIRIVRCLQPRFRPGRLRANLNRKYCWLWQKKAGCIGHLSRYGNPLWVQVGRADLGGIEWGTASDG